MSVSRPADICCDDRVKTRKNYCGFLLDRISKDVYNRVLDTRRINYSGILSKKERENGK